MKKLTLLIIPILLFATVSSLLTSCSCKHEWNDATCTTPKTCLLCNEIEGEPLGHKFENATCISPEICSICGTENGKALGHTIIIDAAVEPTCTETGLTEGSHCEACNEIIIPQNDVEKLEHTEGEWEIAEKGVKTLHCAICDKVLDSKYGMIENIYTASDIPDALMNDKFKNVIDLLSKGYLQSGLDISDATTYNDGETYIFYLDNLEFLGDECDDSHLQPRIIYENEAIENNGTPREIFFGYYNPLKSNGYKETVEIIEDIAEALDISDSGLIDNNYSSSSKLATGDYATFTFTNLKLELVVSNTDGTVEIEIVPID